MNILISFARTGDPVNYVRAVREAGGNPHAAYLPQPDLSYDGLILAGGGDIVPELYGQKNCGSENMNPDRDRAELALLDAFVKAGKPVLGICRGHQIVNVWAGGGMIQDLGELNAVHRGEESDKVHQVFCGPGMLKELYGTRFMANSSHHQAVGPVARDFRVTARSADGVVEAMEHVRLPIYTVQFHPERMTSDETAPGLPIFQWFLKQCNKK